MGAATLKITGNNKKYFSAYGLEKNMLWIQTVNNYISQIILIATKIDTIDASPE